MWSASSSYWMRFKTSVLNPVCCICSKHTDGYCTTGDLDSTVACVGSVSGFPVTKTPYRTRNKELRKRLHKWQIHTQIATKR